MLEFFGASWQRYGLTASLAAIFTYGWLELTDIFCWINGLQKACVNRRINSEDNWSSWKDFANFLHKPTKLLYMIDKDIKKALNLTTDILNTLWRQKLKRDFLLVLFLIFALALIKIHLTPTVALLLRR